VKVEQTIGLSRVEGQQPNCFWLRTVAPFRIRVIFGQAPPRCGQEFVLIIDTVFFFIHVAINLLNSW